MDGDGRYTMSWKCQVSVGELYRWILAKLSDKDIKRALHKYRDLMPRQSDWNRKLTQATNIPELGFRYLYRCGQIDETNHRTMQKMLKYIDRQDVLPYFDTILYNTNSANCSIEELQKILLDKVDVFLQASTALTEEEVHPGLPYDIYQCQPLEDRRLTRSLTKRKFFGGPLQRITEAKRPRRSSISLLPFSQGESPMDPSLVQEMATSSCNQVHSAIKACTLAGPTMQTILNASLVSMLAVLQFTLSQALGSSNQSSSTSTNSISAYFFPTGSALANTIQNSNLPQTLPTLPNLPNSRILAAMPHLVSMVRLHLSANPLRLPPLTQNQLTAHHPSTMPTPSNDAFQRRILLTGGVGITASAGDSCIHYYCRIRLRIKIDIGDSTEALNMIHVDRPDPFARQVDMFLQASNLLRSRCPSEFICNLRFNRLHHLEAFWHDYTTGALRKLIMESVLAPDTHSFVGLGSWANDADPSAMASGGGSVGGDDPAASSGSTSSNGEARQSPRSRRQSRVGRGNSHRRSTPTTTEGHLTSHSPSEPDYNAPLEELRRAVLNVRRHLYYSSFADPHPVIHLQQVAPQNAQAAAQQPQGHVLAPPQPPSQQQLQDRRPPLPARDFDLSLFVSRREYENSRLLLMRNQRTIPSLCRLVTATQFLHVANASGANANSPSNSSISVRTSTQESFSGA